VIVGELVFERWMTNERKQAMKRITNLSTYIFAAFFAVPLFAADEYTAELYDTYCKACHSVSGAGVPIAFNKADWDKRLEQGMDAVVDNAITGIGNMPAQGLCQECMYEDFEDLVNYMADPENKK